MASTAVAHAAPVPSMSCTQGKGPLKKPVDLLAEWRALEPARWEAPAPHKPIADTSEGLKRPTASQSAAQETDPALAEAAAQRTKQLLDNWRVLSTMQQRNTSLDEHELLQHQMSQMHMNIGNMRFTSLEYGR